MKSLKESLFDKDLVEKDLPIDFDNLKEMLFDLILKNLSIPKNNSDIVFHQGEELIYIKRYIDDSQYPEIVCFDLELGVSTLFKELKGGQIELLPCFTTPVLKVRDRLYGARSKGSGWSTSTSDPDTTARLIDKKFDFRKHTTEIYTTPGIIATQLNTAEILDFYDRLIKYFCSDKIKKTLEGYVNKFEWKHAIPGIVVDGILKKLITQS